MVGSLEKIQEQMALRAATGYLELEMPAQAVRTLRELEQRQMLRGEGLLLMGEAFRASERYLEAIDYLNRAAEWLPLEEGIWLSLGWCYKRTDALPRAIESLETAIEVKPTSALAHYNLACYHSLAKNANQSLKFLRKALKLDSELRKLIPGESDFDPMREDPRFQALVGNVGLA